MSLNDKATAALTRELAKCFPERPANDPGHAKLAAALSDTAHTPGPWKVYEYSDSDGTIHNGVSTDRCPSLNVETRSIASMTGSWYTNPKKGEYFKPSTLSENRANARLISAAPELLEACKALAITLEEMWTEKELTAPKFRQCQLGEAVKAARAAIAKAEAK